MYEIERNKFMDILSESDEDTEKFFMIKDEVISKGRSRYYKKPCRICENHNHWHQNCTVINYYPNKILFHAK